MKRGAARTGSVHERVRGFPPLAARGARVLILGSMPGVASLQAGRYYAHPHNAFWRLMGELLEAGPGWAQQPYAARARLLRSRGLAVWDVFASCARQGSLDSAIDDSTAQANDFSGFFRAHPRIRRVFFNGAKAEAGFRRHVLGVPQADLPALRCARLPSTSPAHASLDFTAKLRAWRAVAQALQD